MPVSDSFVAPIVKQARGVGPGMSGIWVSALATAIVLVMLVLLLGIVVVNAFSWFWPSRVVEVGLADGSVAIGELVGREEIPAVGDEGLKIEHRIKLKVGNREVLDSDFMWIDEASLAVVSKPDDLVRVIRSEYGDAFGRIVGAVDHDGRPVDTDARDAVDRLLHEGADLRRERKRLERRLEKTRRPLTRAEERLDLAERSARSGADHRRTEIDDLQQEVDHIGETSWG